MKKLIIIAVAIILIAVLAIVGIMYLNSFQKVTLNLHQGVSGATIYKASEEADSDSSTQSNVNEVKKISSSQEITLPKGSYYAVPEGKNLATDPISFTLGDQPVTVEINPNYSSEFLTSQLNSESAAIQQALFTAFPLIQSDYNVTNGTLYRKGDWYGALLIRKDDDPRAPGDYYRVVAHKDDDTWKVIERPEIVITKSQFKDVPSDVIDTINQLNV